jgi:hypothetical protein
MQLFVIKKAGIAACCKNIKKLPIMLFEVEKNCGSLDL